MNDLTFSKKDVRVTTVASSQYLAGAIFKAGDHEKQASSRQLNQLSA
jgi:hypothetical protein